jgi:hypothetical protein
VKPDWQPWSLVTRLGLTVVLTLLAFLFLGRWLDSVFGTRFVMTLVLSLVGGVAATINCYRMVMDSLGEITQVPRQDADNKDGDAGQDSHSGVTRAPKPSESDNDSENDGDGENDD